MRTIIKATWALTVLVLLGPAMAEAQSDAATSRARKFLGNESRAKGILFFAHPEAEYQSIRLTETSKIADEKKNIVPDHFALTYRYSWKSPLSGDDNTTDLIFFFDGNGRMYSLKAGDTTSAFNPFSVTDIVVEAVKEELIKKVDKDGTDADKRLVRALIENGDARGLLTMLLKLEQP